MLYTRTKSSSRATTLNPLIFWEDFFKIRNLAERFDRFSKNLKTQKHADLGPKLLHFFRVSDQKVIVHDVEHGKCKKTVISDF